MTKTVKLTEPTWRKLERLIKTTDAGQMAMLSKSHDGTRVRIRNDNGADCDQFGILGISGSVFDPATHLQTFKQQTVLTGYLPGDWVGHSSVHGGFVITCEPIPTGKIGWAWVSGVCVVKINVLNNTHGFADADTVAHDVTALVSRRSGPCTILFKEDGVGLKWAIVYHSGANRTHSAPQFVWVKLTNVSLHPMEGKIQRVDAANGLFFDDDYGGEIAKVYRYPTYTTNDLYEVNNVIAAVRHSEAANVIYCVALDTLPRQLAVTSYTEL